MAIAVVMDFEGGTIDQYDALLREAGLGGQPASAIPGLIIHTAGPTEGGWRAVDVWESQDALDRFTRELLMPTAEKVGGIPAPRVQVMPVHGMMR